MNKTNNVGGKIASDGSNWIKGKVQGFEGKELITQGNGTVKLIRINPLAAYPRHLHPDKTEYAFVVEGEPDFTIGDVSYAGEKGDFFIFPVGIEHSIQNKTDREVILLVGSIKN